MTQLDSKLTVTGLVMRADVASTTLTETEVVPPADIEPDAALSVTSPRVKPGSPLPEPILSGVIVIDSEAVGSIEPAASNVAIMVSEGQPASI